MASRSSQAVTVTSITLNPSTVYGGTYTTATITLSGALPVGSGAFYLSSNNAVAKVPASFAGAAGDTQETFIVDVAPLTVGTGQTANISVVYGGFTNSALLTVLPDYTSRIFSPTADSFVQGGSTHASNYGSITNLVIKTGSVPPAADTRVTYMKFDFTGLTAAPSRALLKLYFASAPQVADRVFAVNVYSLPAAANTWTEGGITWDNAPNLIP